MQIKMQENILGSSLDLSGPPDDKERVKLRKRRDRLSAMAQSVAQATGSMRTLAVGPGIAWVYVRSNSYIPEHAAAPRCTATHPTVGCQTRPTGPRPPGS